MSLTLKLGTLAIRTLAKPLGNYIKHNAHEHERFRHFCVRFAQGLHRVDIRLRLGLLQDNAAVERQVQREIAEVEARRAKTSVPTAKTEAQAKWDADRLRKEIKDIEEKHKTRPRIRPLSESKAIETGANFISETFLFCVAGGIIVFEYWRQRRKEVNRRDEVKDRLDLLDGRIARIERAVGADATIEQQLMLALPASVVSTASNEKEILANGATNIKSPRPTSDQRNDAEGRALTKEMTKKL